MIIYVDMWEESKIGVVFKILSCYDDLYTASRWSSLIS